MKHNFRELLIWQDSIKNATLTYQISRKFPKEEMFGITSQMRRAAVSIASNIAEGSGRGTDSQFIHFLDIALGSSFELETQILIIKELGYIENEILETWILNLQSIHKRIIAFRNKLSATT